MATNIESDPFFVLLTDALRAGPGSSQWQQAVESLRQQGLQATDEHRLLIETRENLEAGREFRTVRAGPGFTRKLLAEIENEKTSGSKSHGIPTATLVAILCGALILGAVAYVVWRTSTTVPTAQTAIDDLEAKSQGFVDKIAAASFTGAIPDVCHTIGSLKLDATDGLRPDQAAVTDAKNQGGGLVFTTPVPAGQSFAVDVSIRAQPPTPALLLEAFVTTDASFNPEKGTSSHDLVWQLRDKTQQVLSNGGGLIGDPLPAYRPGDSVRLIVGKDVAIVEVDPAAGGKPQRIWAGPHELGAAPRYVGIRFLQTGAAGKQDLTVQAIKMTTSAGGGN